MKGISPTLHQTDLTLFITSDAPLTVLWTANNAGAMPSLLRLFAVPSPTTINDQSVAQVGATSFNTTGE